MSEWDTFSHTAGKTAGGATGDVADRSYDLVDVDIALLKAVGFKHYRFSLSWGRIIMDEAGTINTAGMIHDMCWHNTAMILIIIIDWYDDYMIDWLLNQVWRITID